MVSLVSDLQDGIGYPLRKSTLPFLNEAPPHLASRSPQSTNRVWRQNLSWQIICKDLCWSLNLVHPQRHPCLSQENWQLASPWVAVHGSDSRQFSPSLRLPHVFVCSHEALSASFLSPLLTFHSGTPPAVNKLHVGRALSLPGEADG